MKAGNMADGINSAKTHTLISAYLEVAPDQRLVIEDNGEEDISLSGIGILRIPRNCYVKDISGCCSIR